MWDRSAALERLVVAAALLLIAWGIGSFGIWDPWELAVAEAARTEPSPADAATRVGPSTIAIRAAFDAIGAREWTGRLPGVLAGWLTCLLAFVMVRRLYDASAAAITVVVLASTPAFLLNARLMMGASIEVLAQTWVGVAALVVFFGRRERGRLLWAHVFLLIGILSSTWASGVLLGPLPPILAVAAWSLLSGDREGPHPVDRWLFPSVAAILVAGVVHAIRLDDPAYSVWVGGGAVGGNPPTFEAAGETIFHGFAPWSAALPIAAIWALAPAQHRSPDTEAAARVLLLWAALAFTAWTIFASRYGAPPYLALVPLAALVAIWIADAARDERARWPSTVGVFLLAGLLIRDYVLYPDSPLRALTAGGLEVPDVYNPSMTWALLFTLVAVLLGLMLVSHPGLDRPNTSGSWRWVRARWEAGAVQRVWLLLIAALFAGCLIFGLASFAVDLPLASVAVRAGHVLFFVPFVVATLVVGIPWLRWAYGELGPRRAWPVLLGGLAVGAFVVLGFQPALSRHFSPKPVYQAYIDLTEGRNEPLAAYKLSTAAARYYTQAPVTPIDNRAELDAFLDQGGQRWAVIEAQQLPTLDRAFRRNTGKHLYVADARSARLSLLAAKPIEGRPNQSFLATTVLDRAPPPQHPVGANFENRIELVGYDLDLPGEDSVGAGQRFDITWYWRALGEVPVGQQVFVHIDGFGLRLNGDHVPVRGRYPTNLWLEGDVIVDTQTLTVPANYRNGDYTIYVGLFRGNKRLKVESGPSDDANRVDAGVLRVR